MGKWEEAQVIDLQQRGWLLVEDGNHGEYRPRPDEFGQGEWAFIRAADMDGGHVLFESAGKINSVARQRITKGIGAGGDVLLSHKGTVGKLALVPLDAPRFVCSPQTTFWRVLSCDNLDRRFLYYYMCSDDFREQLDSRKGETDMADYVSLTAQRELRIRFPAIEEQREIARILGTLDDKIELNRRMNHALEELTRAIFRSWFVDFDPVVAKAAGKKPLGMSAETAAMFPRRFQDSPAGPIPDGWVWKTVDDFVEDIFDGPHATPPEADDGAVFLGIKNLPGTRIDLTEIRHIGEADWPRWTRRVTPRPSDIVFSYEAALGLFALIPEGLRCCLGRRLALARPKASVLSNFLFHTFISDPFQELLVARTVPGSTVDRIALLEFPRFPVLWPGDRIIERFNRIAAPLWARIHNAEAENRNLVELRDSLLPRVMSGELRVATVEASVNATVTKSAGVLPVEPPKRANSSKATDEFKEAILIAALVRHLASEKYPLGRKRYTKFSYMVHRKAEHDVRQQYLHKAAGPYSPWTRYQGPEVIAQRNGYIKPAAGKMSGFFAGDKIGQIDKYLDGRYGFDDAIRWAVDTFRFKKNDDLELLTTVDFAALELADAGKPVTVATIREAIGSHPEWIPKLARAIFSDMNIARALKELGGHFPDERG
ncbi:MAG: restriction endonuclease subunit S [Bacillota bacterium]